MARIALNLAQEGTVAATLSSNSTGIRSNCSTSSSAHHDLCSYMPPSPPCDGRAMGARSCLLGFDKMLHVAHDLGSSWTSATTALSPYLSRRYLLRDWTSPS